MPRSPRSRLSVRQLFTFLTPPPYIHLPPGLELSLKLPASEPEAYFAPISPAHSSDKIKGDILGMLQRTPQQQTDDTVNLAAKLGT